MVSEQVGLSGQVVESAVCLCDTVVVVAVRHLCFLLFVCSDCLSAELGLLEVGEKCCSSVCSGCKVCI